MRWEAADRLIALLDEFPSVGDLWEGVNEAVDRTVICGKCNGRLKMTFVSILKKAYSLSGEEGKDGCE